MNKRSLLKMTVAGAAVVLLTAGGLTLAEGQGVWVQHHGHHDDDGSAGWLGVRIEEAVDHDKGGALVRSVVDGSPAADAGLERGDIIVAVDGRTVRGPGSLTERIRQLEGGDRVALTVIREGREIEIDAVLEDIGAMVERRVRVALDGMELDLEGLENLEGLEGLAQLGQLRHLEHLEHLGDMDFDFDFDFSELENLGEQFEGMGQHFEHMGRVLVQRCEDGECQNVTIDRRGPRMGVGLSSTTPELRRHLGGTDDAGALVDRVIDGSPAAEAGIEVGDLIVAIDGRDVKSAWEIRAALSDRAGERVQVDVIRDGSSRRFDLELPDANRDDERRSRGPRT